MIAPLLVAAAPAVIEDAQKGDKGIIGGQIKKRKQEGGIAVVAVVGLCCCCYCFCCVLPAAGIGLYFILK